MFKQLQLLIAAILLLPLSMQTIAQDLQPSHKCDGCQVYTEEQLQQMRDAYEPYVQVSEQRMPESFKNIEQYNGRQDLSNQGTDFYLMFLSNYNNAGINLFLDITSDVNTNGTVTVDGIGYSESFSITANTITRINLPSNTVVATAQTPEQLGIRVVSDDPVSVYGTNQIQYTTDSFLGLPVSILGTQYLTVTYSTSAEFGIVSPYDNNVVTITPSNSTSLGNAAGVPFDVTLNQGETYLVLGTDLTGSIVESSLPVSVFSGATCTNIPPGFGYCDHIIQQLPPVSSWGETFVTRPLEGRNNGDTWRFMASQDNTDLFINGTLVTTLGFADYYETNLAVASYIESSNPILATQFANGNTWDGTSYPGDPFMMIIPPYQQFLGGYTFATPADGFVNNYFTSSVENDGIPGMTLDGMPLNPVSYAPVSTTTFSAAAFPTNINSTYNLTNTNGFTSGLYVYGFNDDDSYGYPGGLSLITINEGSGPEIELGATVVDLFCVSNESGVDIEITAIITDAEEPFVQSATVFWRSIGDGAYTSIPMTDNGSDNWSASISSAETEYPGIEFYISASDGQVTNTSPSTDPINNPYSIGIDNIPPDITHTPVMSSEPGVDILIEAEVFDETESVSLVELFYRVPGGTPIYTEMAMNNVGGDAWEGTIPGASMTAQGLEYYIQATDNHGVSCTYGSADDPFLIEAGLLANIPPVPVDFPFVAPQVATGETYNLTVQFESPEEGQTTDVVVNYGGLPGFSYTVTPGNIAMVDIELIGQNDNLGTHTIEFVATDDGEPVESTTVFLDITVYDPLAGHVICIPEGWSAISTYNDPDNPAMEDIFAALVAEDKVEFVVNQDGIFWPSQNINLFEGWDVKKGYKIKMNEEGCLGIVGEMPEDKSFTAMAGASYVPVLCSDPVAAIDIFSQMGDDFLFAFDIYDQLVYWPEGGLFTLNTLEPGKGYLVSMTAEGMASYDCGKAGETQANIIPAPIANAPWTISKTGSVHLISVNKSAFENMKQGDFLGVFNQEDQCAGFIRYDGNQKNQLLVAYGDDMTTANSEGMLDTEQMTFKIYRTADQSEVAANVLFDYSFANAEKFAENGRSMILKVTESATSINETALNEISIHPNPGNGLFNIEIPSADENIALEVMNISGQIIHSEVIGQNATGIQIDLSGHSKGVFFVKFTGKQQTIIRKVVIQ